MAVSSPAPARDRDTTTSSLSTDESTDSRSDDDPSLTPRDFGNLTILYLLYFCQSIPSGLVGATIPAILKRFLPYGRVGMFTMTIYPYGLKLIWAPIVDSYWSSRIGRHLTWMIPTQLLSGFMLVAIGAWTVFYFQAIERSDETSHEALYLVAWVAVSVLGAIQSCATDGGSVWLLPRGKLHWVSSAHTLGSISGSFAAYSLFMFIFDAKLTYLHEAGPVLGSYISYWGILFMALVPLIPLLRRRAPDTVNVRRPISEAYMTILSICRIRPIQETIVVHLLARLAFEVNDGATDLKLIDKGFGNANIAWLVLMVVPFDLASAHVAGVLSKRLGPLRVWSIMYSVRLFSLVVTAVVVFSYPGGPPSSFYMLVVFLQRVLSVVSATMMFTSFLQFHLQIADPAAAGTYMTILATAQNMGGILPRIPAMMLIDVTTKSTCEFPHNLDRAKISKNMVCDTLEQRMSCTQIGGRCDFISDGYYVTGGICLVVGILVFVFYLRHASKRLERLPLAGWALKST